MPSAGRAQKGWIILVHWSPQAMAMAARPASMPIVVEAGSPPTPDNVLVAAHSDDADFRPLSSYPYQALRCLHILGAWKWEERQEG